VSALHAEWTKTRTVPGTVWLLLGVVALTVPLGALAASATPVGGDPAKASLTGVALGQAVVAILAVTAISGEYGTRMIATTLTAVPRRTEVLAAKGTVVAGLTLAAGTAAVLGSVVVGRILLPNLSLTDGAVLRAAVGSVLYLTLVALLSLGIATVVRDAAAAVGVVLGLLYLSPIIAALVSDPDWYRRLQQVSPMTAGLAVQVTVDVESQPIAPWTGLAVLAAWAAAALVAGGVTLRVRDA
jgi:ABC-2 type transport system permease protein